MIKISKSGNSILVEGLDNKFYPDNGKLTFPSNSLILTIDESDMATFRSAANNDVMFSGLIEDITISDEAVTKDDIITKFGVVAYSTSGGGSTDWNDITNKPTIPTLQTDSYGDTNNYIYANAGDVTYGVVSYVDISTYGGPLVLQRRDWAGGQSNIEIPSATSTTNGCMTSSDKTKLDGIPSMSVLTQSEYDALPNKDANTLYFIKE